MRFKSFLLLKAQNWVSRKFMELKQRFYELIFYSFWEYINMIL